MSALAVSGIIFILTSGGILLGALLRRTLPKHHLNEHARDVVRLGVGLIAAIAALVEECCGLLNDMLACLLALGHDPPVKERPTGL